MLCFVCRVCLRNLKKTHCIIFSHLYFFRVNNRTVSILDPLSRGFLKAFCYKTFTATSQNLRGNRIKQQTGEILMQQYESFQSVFQSDNFHVPYCKFKHFREITKHIQSLGKKHLAKRVKLLEIFSSENWDNLKDRKTKHSLIDCKGCLNNKKL